MKKSNENKVIIRTKKGIRINKRKAAEYLKIGLSVNELAKLYGVDNKTIKRRLSKELQKRENEEKIEFQEKKKRLIDKQFEVAMEGNAIMLIWLGKNWLKQTDKVESENDINIRIIKEEIK